MHELLALVILLVFSGLFALAALICGFIFSPKGDSAIKNSTYECGMTPFSDAKIQFNMPFFMYAILFLIFDIETIMLFPFALIFGKLGLLALVEVSIFILLLVLGLIYAARKNLLRFR
ncbi:MAG: NADH-quinone oxidoreductase subunit A [Candidatus Gastranaerophilales bacterium]|nr:NADH-quinone oxidoreductase subunit A [Candidatus Gastranaerophilales bacterium]